MPSTPPPAPLFAAPAPARWTRLMDELTRGSRARWLAISFILCATLPAFFSWPEFPLPPEVRRNWTFYWDLIVQRKIDNPAFDYTKEFPAEKNEAKRNFRVVVPLVATVTHTGIAGTHVLRFTLQAVLLVCLLLAAERASGDRVTALATALAIAGTFVGTSVWRDICRWFDNCAHAWLAIALVVRSPLIAGGAVVLAGFTDERSLLIVPLLALFHHFTGSPRQTVIGIVAAVPIYVVARVALGQLLHLGTPSQGIAELDIFADNINHIAPGFWFGLEGGWLLVGLALWRARTTLHAKAGWALALATFLPVFAALGVGDFTRSANYAFPAVLAALALLRSAMLVEAADLRRIAVAAAIVSLVVPNVFIMRNAFHENSVPVQLVFDWLKAHLG